MEGSTVATALISALATVAVAGFGYLGVRFTARASRAANAEEAAAATAAAVQAGEEERLREAWPELLKQINESLVEPVRADLDRERKARERLEARVDAQGRRIRSLSSEVHRWQQVAKSLARWGLALRDQVIRLGGQVPTDPDELITLRAIEDASQHVIDDDEDPTFYADLGADTPAS